MLQAPESQVVSQFFLTCGSKIFSAYFITQYGLHYFEAKKPHAEIFSRHVQLCSRLVLCGHAPRLECRCSRPKGANNKNKRILCGPKICSESPTCSGKLPRCTGRQKLIESLRSKAGKYLLMDRAYEDDETRALAIKRELIPSSHRKNSKMLWKYDAELYKHRNEVNRIFLRLKRFRKVFTRYDKLDIIYFSIVTLALIFDSLFM